MQFCEIDLSDIVSPSSLAPFLDEIKKREKQRRRAAKKVTSLLAALHIILLNHSELIRTIMCIRVVETGGQNHQVITY